MRKFLSFIFTVLTLTITSTIVFNTTASALAQPQYRINATAQQAYKIVLNNSASGLNLCDNVVQNFCINGSDEIYITQNFLRDVDNGNVETTKGIYISRCVPGTTPGEYIVQDRMKLKNIGHNQTLDMFEYNSQIYFWIGCKPHGTLKGQNTLQIARVKYQAGAVIDSYTNLCRLSNLNYANLTATNAGEFIHRVDACLSSDKQRLMLATRFADYDVDDEGNDILTDRRVQYSSYNVNVINRLLDEKENQSSKYVSFKNNET